MNIYFPESINVWEGGNQYLESLISNTRKALRFSSRKILLNHKNPVFMSKFFDSNKLIEPNIYKTIITNSIQFPWYRDFKGKEYIQWIFDSQDLTHPEYFSSQDLLARREQILGAIARNCMFYFSSQFQEELFLKTYTNSRSAGVLHFTYLPGEISLNFEWGCRVCDEGQYFYLPNQWWIHKNHILTIKAFQEYRRRGGKYHLVLSGNQTDYRWPNLESEVHKLIGSDPTGIHNLGFIDKLNTNFLFKKCVAVIQPSSSEGWSTSIEAAIRFNKYILANSIEVHYEQLNSYPHYAFFDVENKFSITNQLFGMESLKHDFANYNYKIRELRFRQEIISVIENIEKVFEA